MPTLLMTDKTNTRIEVEYEKVEWDRPSPGWIRVVKGRQNVVAIQLSAFVYVEFIGESTPVESKRKAKSVKSMTPAEYAEWVLANRKMWLDINPLEKLQEDYPNVDVEQKIIDLEHWLRGVAPKKRKTEYGKFMATCLARDNEKSAGWPGKAKHTTGVDYQERDFSEDELKDMLADDEGA